MGFSVSCAACGREFSGIDESMLGRKAKCGCGAVVQLTRLNHPDPDSKIADAALPSLAPPAPRASAADSQPETPDVRDPSDRRSPSLRTAPAPPRPKPRRPKAHPPQLRADPRRRSTPKSHPAAGTPARPVEHTDPSRPLIEDTFSDLDAILQGGADSTPLQVRKTAPPTVAPTPDLRPAHATARQPAPEPAARPTRTTPTSRLDPLAALLAATAGLIFCGIMIATRFSPLTETPVDWLGQPLYGMFHGVFESGVLANTNRLLMVGAGWGFTVVAGAAMLASAMLYLRVGLQVLIGVNWIGWSRAAVATLGVIGLFLSVAAFISYQSHHDSLEQKLSQLAPEAFGFAEEPKNIQQLKISYAKEHRAFLVAMAFVGTLAMSMFLGSMVSLMTDSGGKPAEKSQLRQARTS